MEKLERVVGLRLGPSDGGLGCEASVRPALRVAAAKEYQLRANAAIDEARWWWWL